MDISPGLLFCRAVCCGLVKISQVYLGVSAGAINMARHSLDTKESPVPYAGLGLADITVKPHFELGNQEVLSTLLQISMDLSAFSRRSSVIDKACKVGFE